MTSMKLTPHLFVLPQHVTKATTSTRCAACGFTNRAKVHTDFKLATKMLRETTQGLGVADVVEHVIAEAQQKAVESIEPPAPPKPLASYVTAGKLSSDQEALVVVNRQMLETIGCSKAQVKELAGRQWSALPNWVRTQLKRRFAKAKQEEPRKLHPAAGELAFYINPSRFRPMLNSEGHVVPLNSKFDKVGMDKVLQFKHNLAPLTPADVDTALRQ